MKYRSLIANCGKDYHIYLGVNLLDAIDFKKNKLVVIIDANLSQIYESLFLESLGIDVIDYLVVPSGEGSKTRKMKQNLEDQLLAKHLGRDIMILAIGGGMICDLVGFLAATYCRGVPVIYWPTSLLAMVDASIGGKTAVNTSYGKNLIGVFSTPYSVWMDISFLKTLPKDEFINGMAEVIKHALIFDKDLFKTLLYSQSSIMEQKQSLLMDMIEKSCLIKNAIVSQDAYEIGVRSILNFGHTIGHAIEHSNNYKIKHGEAVAMGMLIEAYIAFLKGVADIQLVEKIKEILKVYQFKMKTTFLKDTHAILNCIYSDKKNKHQEIHMVLIEQIGSVFVEQGFYTQPIEEDLIIKALTWAEETL